MGLANYYSYKCVHGESTDFSLCCAIDEQNQIIMDTYRFREDLKKK